jgi:HdeA/HdeB family
VVDFFGSGKDALRRGGHYGRRIQLYGTDYLSRNGSGCQAFEEAKSISSVNRRLPSQTFEEWTTSPGEHAVRSRFNTLYALSIILAAVPAAQAQETVDVAKITCEQFLTGKVADSRSVTIWLSGYFNGTRNNTVLDVSALQKNSQDVMDYCLSHPSVILMNAVKTLFGKNK